MYSWNSKQLYNCLKDSQFAYAGRQLKGTVRPEKISLGVVSLDWPRFGHKALYVFSFLLLIPTTQNLKNEGATVHILYIVLSYNFLALPQGLGCCSVSPLGKFFGFKGLINTHRSLVNCG